MKMMAWSDSLSSTAWKRGRSGGRPLHSLRTEVPRGDTKPAALTRHIDWPESIRHRRQLMYWKWRCVSSQSQQVVLGLLYWRVRVRVGLTLTLTLGLEVGLGVWLWSQTTFQGSLRQFTWSGLCLGLNKLCIFDQDQWRFKMTPCW